jgi:hypothetical protein
LAHLGDFSFVGWGGNPNIVASKYRCTPCGCR